MFSVLAVVCFAVGFVFRAAGVSVPAWAGPGGMELLGLAFLALHLAPQRRWPW